LVEQPPFDSDTAQQKPETRVILVSGALTPKIGEGTLTKYFV